MHLLLCRVRQHLHSHRLHPPRRLVHLRHAQAPFLTSVLRSLFSLFLVFPFSRF
jgi:hypothetical protein